MNWQKKDPLSKIPIKVKLPLGFIALYLIVFGVGSFFVITSVYSPLSREILLRLQSESLAQATIFDKKLETLNRRTEDFASDGFIRTQTEILAAGHAGVPASHADADLLAAHDALQNHLRVNKLPLIKEFIDLHVYDLKLQKLAGIRAEALPIREYLEPIIRANTRKISAIIPPNETDSFPTAAIVTPLWDIEHENRIGYLACHFQVAVMIEGTLQDYYQAMPESEMEKHLTLIDQSGLRLEIPWWYLKQVQGGADMAALEGAVGLKILPADPSAELALHVGKHGCQNGQEMFGQSYPLKSAGWSALLELNATDALAPLRVLEGKLLGITIIVALTTLILLFFPIQYLIRPLGELERVASRIKEGDFSGRVKIHSQDEIGSLARTFNLMAGAIEERTQSLEQTAADLQKRERELRIQHDRLNTVVHSMTDGLILLNAQEEVVLFNKAAEPVADLLARAPENLAVRKCEVNNTDHRNCIPCLLDTTRAT
ncbi:MAG: HAMP domain-containing protein, partial [bacterium]